MLTRELSERPLIRSDFRVPRLATVDLSGWVVGGTASYGKHLFTELGEPRSARSLVLHTHRRMDGWWHVTHGSAGSPAPQWRVRVRLHCEDRRAHGVDLPVVELLAPAGRQRLVATLGPDLMDPGAPLGSAAQQLSRRESPVAEALLDQRLVAGLGTIWVSEALFACRIHPLRAANDVAEPEALLATASQAMRRAASTERPRWQVYGKAGRPCSRCGRAIVRVAVTSGPARRGLYCCPNCQR